MLRDPKARTASKKDYLELMASFPTGVAVITTVDPDGAPRGMTCSSLTSVTLAPPTLLVCLRSDSATSDALCARGGFAVNLLHARGRRAAEIFSGPVADRFGQVAWHPSRSGMPWLVDDAFALAECTVTGLAQVGTHTVVLGEVGEVLLFHDSPLLYGMRRFAAWRAGAGAVRPVST